MGIRHVASLLLLSPPNPLRWALAGTPIMGSSNIHRLVPAYLFGAAVVERSNYHGYARVGGVISTHVSTRFCTSRGQCPRGKKNQMVMFSEPPDASAGLPVGYPRKTGVWGADDCEHPLREGAHRNQPPAILWFLSDRSERNNRPPPRPAGRNP